MALVHLEIVRQVRGRYRLHTDQSRCIALLLQDLGERELLLRKASGCCRDYIHPDAAVAGHPCSEIAHTQRWKRTCSGGKC